MNSYRNQIGTLSGINSPLLREEVTAEKFEPWELEVFAIFMSNFAVPFIDSMDSAFGYTKEYGSKGRGLDALKFSTGGDIVAGGILQNMVKYVLDTCAQTEVPIYSSFDLYRNGNREKGQQTNRDFFKMEGNKATIADLMPILVGTYYDKTIYDSIISAQVNASGSPLKTQEVTEYFDLHSTVTPVPTEDPSITVEPTVDPASGTTPTEAPSETPTEAPTATEAVSAAPTQTTNASPGRNEYNRLTPTPKQNQTEALPASEGPCALPASAPTEASGGELTDNKNRSNISKTKATPTPIKNETYAAPGSTATPSATATPEPTQQVSYAATSVADGTEVFRNSWILAYFGKDGEFAEPEDDTVNRMIPTLASLPTLYIEGEGGNPVQVFNLGDGWDAQVWALCLNYAVFMAQYLDAKEVELSQQSTLSTQNDPNTQQGQANTQTQQNQQASTNNTDQLAKIFSGLCDYPLFMDACGNIIVKVDGRKIVAIPACLNRNLRKDHRVNLITSAILNDICVVSDVSLTAALSNNFLSFKNDPNGWDGATTVYGTLGTGLGLDTSGAVECDADGNFERFTDVGLSQYGNMILYNTSDTLGSDWSPEADRTQSVKDMINRSEVDFNNNLCMGFIGSILRLPGTNLNSMFGLDSGLGDLNITSFTDSIISIPLTTRWAGDGMGSPSYGNSLGNYPMAGMAQAAQLCQMWGVSVGNSVGDANRDFKANATDADDKSISIFKKQGVHTSNTLLFSTKLLSTWEKYLGHGGLIQLIGLGAEIGGIALLALGAVPVVGWVLAVGGCLVAVGVCVWNLIWGDDRPDIAFEEKITFGMNIDNLHGKYMGIGDEAHRPDNICNINYINAMADTPSIGEYLLGEHRVYAAALVNGKVPGFKLNDAKDKDAVYNAIIGDGNISEDDAKKYFVGGQMYPQQRSKRNVKDAIAESVSVIAVASDDIAQAKQYMCLYGKTDTYDQWAPQFYLDTLKFYGFGDSNNTPDKVLNTDIFKAVNSRLTGDTTGLYDEIFGDDGLTEEQKLQKIQDYTYLALTPESKGVEYRNQLLVSGIDKWIATEYDSICNKGGKAESNKTGTNGFLQFTPYSENFMTKWIVENWNKVLIITIYISMVLIFLLGAIKGKKLGWIVANILSTTVLLILLPTTGEIAPYVSDKIVQEMFQSSAQYWAINEAIEDDYLMQETVKSDLSEGAVSLIKAASTANTASTLMIKHDISRKLICTNKTDETELLKLASTRWMLSSLMRQVSADEPENAYNYLYNTVGDTRWALKDLFLFYRNGPAINLQLKYGDRTILEQNGELNIDVAGGTEMLAGGEWSKYENLGKLWYGWSDISPDGAYNNGNLLTSSMYEHRTMNSASSAGQTWKSVTVTNEMIRDNSDHFAFAYMPRLLVQQNTDGFKANDNDKRVIRETRGMASFLSSMEAVGSEQINTEVLDRFQSAISGGNNGTDPRNELSYAATGSPVSWRVFEHSLADKMMEWHDQGAIQEFGYLRMTEDTIPYFYFLIKDTFSYTYNTYEGIPEPIGVRADTYGLGALATELLGYIDTDTVDYYSNKPVDYILEDGTLVHGKEGIRRNIMIDHDISKIAGENLTRDFLDLEYLFTNYIPYMAEIMFITGGEDGTNGRLQNYTMQQAGFDIYGDSEASWLFRSNWVLKLLSSNNYSAGAIIKDSKGNEYKVEHQLFPYNYRVATQGTRPMIFSEAQMFAYGLTERDLSAVELACVETNREVCRTWEKLVNFVNTDGITAEIIEEQMAFEAAMAFNRNFVDDNFISAEMALYPTSYDLRSINFDSVMKMLVISDNYNNASLTQPAIYSVIAENGTISGWLAMALAFMAQVVIPLMRNVALGIIFYCSMICAFYNILNDSKEKAAATVGGGVLGMLYAAVTIVYYASYWFFITRNSPDMILTENGFNTGHNYITAKIIVLLLISLVYVWITIKVFIVRVVFKDIKHMGLNIMKQYASTAYSKLKRFGNKIKSKFGSKKAAEDNRLAAANDVAEARGGAGSSSEEVKVTGGEMTLANTRKNPVPVIEVNDPDSATYIEAGDGEDSGFIEEEKEEERANEKVEANSKENGDAK